MEKVLMTFLIILTFTSKILGQNNNTISENEPQTIKLICGSELLPPPLYILQYKKEQHSLDTSKLRLIYPNDVKGFTFIKSKTAEKKYGEKGVNGVILIKVDETTFNALKRK